MGESVQTGTWHWYNIRDDLMQQGNLGSRDIVIDPLSVRDHFCAGTFLGQAFTVTWVKDRFLLLSMVKFSQELVDAFSAVVEYEPFVSYHRDGYITVEWDKVDPEKRWDELQGEDGLSRIPRR